MHILRSPAHRRRAAWVVALLAPGMLGACQPTNGDTTHSATAAPLSASSPASLPLGEIAGAAVMDASTGLENPLANDAAAVAEGHRLFVSMNCAGCHGYGAGGAMGPDLTDPLWRYGGTPAGIYKSIFEGRPQGMPSWGRNLPSQQIWKITAYLQSLGGAVAAQSYHAGLQGDHDLTATAPEAHGFDDTLTAPTSQVN